VKPCGIGQQYDEIATWWHNQHINSGYGVAQVKRALSFIANGTHALDVGCGAGGRLASLLEEAGLSITGIDASAKMIELAKVNHPDGTFIHDDITNWETSTRFDFILVWDCLFHLPLDQQKPVLSKLCRLLANGGIMIHSFGDGVGEHTDTWRGQEFYYSSIGISQNLDLLRENGMSMLHLELDQFPEKHVYAISKKT